MTERHIHLPAVSVKLTPSLAKAIQGMAEALETSVPVQVASMLHEKETYPKARKLLIGEVTNQLLELILPRPEVPPGLQHITFRSDRWLVDVTGSSRVVKARYSFVVTFHTTVGYAKVRYSGEASLYVLPDHWRELLSRRLS